MYKLKYLSANILLALSSVCIATSCSGSRTDRAEAQTDVTADTSVIADTGNDSLFVISGVDIDSKAIADGDFINLRDLPESERPDSSYDGFLLPYTDCVVTSRPDVAVALLPDVKSYVIDGKEATKADFEALTAERIKKVSIDGDKVFVETRVPSEKENPAVSEAISKESQLKGA